eukprot:gene16426-22640_t
MGGVSRIVVFGKALNAAGCVLVGGHTTEGDALALGFSVTGSAKEGALMTKGGLSPGQLLILTKPIGTGVLMEESILKGRGSSSNAQAAEILMSHGCKGCTDVTGFGLVGHLVEMARPSKVHIELDLDEVPLLEGAAELVVERDAISSLHASNARAASAISNFVELKNDPRWPLLVDPQTGGGLLAGVDPSQAEACIKEQIKLDRRLQQ